MNFTQQRRTSSFTVPLLVVISMGVFQVFNSLGWAGADSEWGVLPRHLDHLTGILTFHFRHANWAHYLSNALPLLILPGIATTLAPSATKKAWLMIPLVSGCFVWLIGRNAIHIGASGMVYGWFFFTLGLALFHRSWAGLVAAILAFMFFGGLVWVFAGGDTVSWEGHLGGAIAGLLAARVTKQAAKATQQEKPIV